MSDQQASNKKRLFPADAFVQFGFVFFIVLSIPYDLQLYKSLSAGPFFSFENWFQLATYRTSFIAETPFAATNFSGYYNWLIAAVIAVAAVSLAKLFGRNRYTIDAADKIYWLRVLLRYRLALAIIFLGIVNVLPLQIPEPTLSDLHTEYGRLLPWKLYYITNGIATAGYLPVIGSLEVLGGLLLLNRRTTVIGSGLLVALLLNVVIVNYVYEIGEQIYSSFLLLLALVLFLYDGSRFYGVLFRSGRVYPEGYWPRYTSGLACIRPYLQVFFLLILASFSVFAYSAWKETDYPFPKGKGVTGLYGLYDVHEFVLNADTIPYAIDDPIRWKDVVFEKWNTLSIRSNEPVKIDSTKPRIGFGEHRNYEYIGNGGRHFYAYRYSKAKGDAPARLLLTGKTDTSQKLTFSFRKIGQDTVLLQGKTPEGDSLTVKLLRQEKKYLLREGRRKAIQIY